MISQPTFFPWIGYFDMIDQVNIFVVLDDANFSKQRWHQRNKFKSKKGMELFTVPVKNVNISSKINQIEIFDTDRVVKKFKKFIITNYSKSKYFELYSQDIFKVFDKFAKKGNLSNLNFEIIKFFLDILKIKTKIFLSSDLKIEEKRSEKIIAICDHFQRKEYFSSLGANEYLTEDKNLFIKKNIKIYLHNYEHPTYSQLYPPFIPNACILDLLFNEGKKSIEIIRQGRKLKKNLF